jgi:hypothetical protein
LRLRFRTTNQNPNQIHNANNNLNLRNYSIFLSFFLDTSTSSVQVKKPKSQGSEFLFCSQIIILQLFTTRGEQFLLLSETEIFQKCSCRNFKN